MSKAIQQGSGDGHSVSSTVVGLKRPPPSWLEGFLVVTPCVSLALCRASLRAEVTALCSKPAPSDSRCQVRKTHLNESKTCH